MEYTEEQLIHKMDLYQFMAGEETPKSRWDYWMRKADKLCGELMQLRNKTVNEAFNKLY